MDSLTLLKEMGLAGLKELARTQRREVTKLMKGIGLRKTGHYYIGTFNEDVIAGYCLDKPPLNAYVWRFVLPAYDNLDFFHLSLGERILHFMNGSSVPDETPDAKAFLQRDWAEFSRIQSAGALGKYLDSTDFLGAPATWARFLTHIRCGRFEAAARIAEDPEKVKDIKSMPGPAASFVELSAARQHQGWEACQPLLVKWQQRTRENFLAGRIQM